MNGDLLADPKPINDIFGTTLGVLDNNNSQITNGFTYDSNGMMSLTGNPVGGTSA